MYFHNDVDEFAMSFSMFYVGGRHVTLGVLVSLLFLLSWLLPTVMSLHLVLSFNHSPFNIVSFPFCLSVQQDL